MKHFFCQKILIGISASFFLLTIGCLNAQAQNKTEARPTATATPATSTPATAAAKPAAAKPATSKPATAAAKPATSTPAAAKPATSKPATAKPATAKPATSTPATAKPANDTIKIELVRMLQKPEIVALFKEPRNYLNLSIKPEKVNSDETLLSDEIAARMQGPIRKNIAGIEDNGKCDVVFSFRPSHEVFDQDGDYYRLRGAIELKMTSADGKRLFGATKIDFAPATRVLGKDAAIVSFSEQVATQSVEWCGKEMNRIIEGELDAALVTIKLPAVPKEKKRDAVQDAASIKAIGEKLANQSKFIKIDILSQDSQTGVCQYRLVYFFTEFPNGLINELNTLFSTAKQ